MILHLGGFLLARLGNLSKYQVLTLFQPGSSHIDASILLWYACFSSLRTLDTEEGDHGRDYNHGKDFSVFFWNINNILFHYSVIGFNNRED